MTNKFPKILCSSVIRSTQRGDSHGGVYEVDLNNETFEQVIDWDNPNIDFDSGGGDRGLRGLQCHGDYIYASGGTSLFKFDKHFKLLKEYTSPILGGTHENLIIDNKIYCIANLFDSILRLDLTTELWDWGMQFNTETVDPLIFNPITDTIEYRDTLHLDSLQIKNNTLWFTGSFPKKIYGLHLINHKFTIHELFLNKWFPVPIQYGTHNAQWWKDGIVYNLAVEGCTVYEDYVNNDMTIWQTPSPSFEYKIRPGDHSRINYTRGMVLFNDYIISGTSPARILVFELGSEKIIKEIEISQDIRNSICSIAIKEE